MSNTYTAQSFVDARCKRDSVAHAVKMTLGIDEDANLRKHLVKLVHPDNLKENGDSLDQHLIDFAQGLKARERSLAKNSDVFELGFILNIDPEKVEKRTVKVRLKKERGLTKVQNAFYGVFKRFARKDFVMQAVAFEAARSCSYKTVVQINQAGEAIDAKESLISSYADQAFGLAATCPLGNVSPQYGDTDALEQWLLEAWSDYLAKVPHGFDWHTEKAWKSAASNVQKYVEAKEQQA